jgi:hypothetical protein
VSRGYVGGDANAVAYLKQRIEKGDDLFVGYVDVEIVSAPGSLAEVIDRLGDETELGTDWDVENRTYVSNVNDMGKSISSVRVWYCGDPIKTDASTAVVALVGKPYTPKKNTGLMLLTLSHPTPPACMRFFVFLQYAGVCLIIWMLLTLSHPLPPPGPASLPLPPPPPRAFLLYFVYL